MTVQMHALDHQPLHLGVDPVLLVVQVSRSGFSRQVLAVTYAEAQYLHGQGRLELTPGQLVRITDSDGPQ